MYYPLDKTKHVMLDLLTDKYNYYMECLQFDINMCDQSNEDLEQLLKTLSREELFTKAKEQMCNDLCPAEWNHLTTMAKIEAVADIIDDLMARGLLGSRN